MKMADGGFRPAYNLQFATDTESRIIVGVAATNSGTDSQQLEPMLDEIERRTGKIPEQQLVDGGYMNFAAVGAPTRAGGSILPAAPRTAPIVSNPLEPATR